MFWITRASQLKHISGYCVQSSNKDGEPARMVFCDEDKKNQIWTLHISPDSMYGLVKDEQHKMCLDLDGDTVVVNKCTGTCSQRWWIAAPTADSISESEDDPLLAECEKEDLL